MTLVKPYQRRYAPQRGKESLNARPSIEKGQGEKRREKMDAGGNPTPGKHGSGRDTIKSG
jgi:hypothetical protein